MSRSTLFSAALPIVLPLLMSSAHCRADNPVFPNIGVCDPQVRIFNGRVYLYASHDTSVENKKFVMENWWAWSSDDLVNWELGSTLRPEDTYLKRPFASCWAGDTAFKDGKYYWYFSGGPLNIGVVEGATPLGPWKDPLGKPLIAKGLTPTAQRDPGILMDDDGANYMVYGTFDFFLVRLGDDMISLAEPPRLLELDRKNGPIAEGKTDDKPFLHKRNGKYYLSWGCYYAMADNPYGPYVYKDTIIKPETTDEAFQITGLTRDRHGSFFEFKGQDYFMCNDFSQPGTTNRFRNSILSYVHYRANGEMAPIHISALGVGQYVATDKVEAENFFQISGGAKAETPNGGFEVRGLSNQSALIYSNVRGLGERGNLTVRLANGGAQSGKIEVRRDGATGRLLGSARIPATGAWG